MTIMATLSGLVKIYVEIHCPSNRKGVQTLSLWYMGISFRKGVQTLSLWYMGISFRKGVQTLSLWYMAYHLEKVFKHCPNDTWAYHLEKVYKHCPYDTWTYHLEKVYKHSPYDTWAYHLVCLETAQCWIISIIIVKVAVISIIIFIFGRIVSPIRQTKAPPVNTMHKHHLLQLTM